MWKVALPLSVLGSSQFVVGTMANAYSASRPLHGSEGVQTKVHEEMAVFAYSQDVQDLLQKMTADLFTERPKDIIDYLVNWLKSEKQRRAEKEETEHASAQH